MIKAKVSKVIVDKEITTTSVRYAKHYEEVNNFIISGYGDRGWHDIVIKPSEAIDLIGDLTKYVLNNMKRIDDD